MALDYQANCKSFCGCTLIHFYVASIQFFSQIYLNPSECTVLSINICKIFLLFKWNVQEKCWIYDKKRLLRIQRFSEVCKTRFLLMSLCVLISVYALANALSLKRFNSTWNFAGMITAVYRQRKENLHFRFYRTYLIPNFVRWKYLKDIYNDINL